MGQSPCIARSIKSKRMGIPTPAQLLRSVMTRVSNREHLNSFKHQQPPQLKELCNQLILVEVTNERCFKVFPLAKQSTCTYLNVTSQLHIQFYGKTEIHMWISRCTWLHNSLVQPPQSCLQHMIGRSVGISVIHPK